MRKYCIQLLIAVILITSIVGCFNWIVDPFDVYRIIRKEGFNAHKSQYGKYARLAKIIQIERYPRVNVALGNSRTQMGIDMSHPFWNGKEGWNLAVNGADIYLIRRFLEHAIVVAPLEKVFIGIDFGMFNGRSIQKLEDERYFAVNKNGELNHWHKLKQYILTLGTFSALSASIETLRKQRLIDNAYGLDGRRLTSHARMKVQGDGGHDKEFSTLEKRTVEIYWDSINGKIEYKHQIAPGWTTMDEFRKIIDLGQKNKIKMYFVISPCHARWFDAEYNLGLGAKVEQWKRNVTQIVDQANLMNDQVLIELWDFSGYSLYSMEEVPPASDQKTLMQWYVDPSHYSVELGHIMLDRILEKAASSEFGIQLTASAIEEILQQQRQERQDYLKAEPHLTTLLREKVLGTIEELKQQKYP